MTNVAQLAQQIINDDLVAEAQVVIAALRAGEQPNPHGGYPPSDLSEPLDPRGEPGAGDGLAVVLTCLDCTGHLSPLGPSAPNSYKCDDCGLVWNEYELRSVEAPPEPAQAPQPEKPAKGPTMQQRQKQLSQSASDLAGDLDTKRWELAALAARAKETKIDSWAIVIGAAVRREPRTIRGWAQTWEWVERMACLRYAEQLDFSFFQAADAYHDRIGERDLLHLLETYAGDKGRTVDEFRTQLRDLVGKPADDLPKKFRKASEKYYGMVDAAPKAVAEQLNAAALALSLAAEHQARHDLAAKKKADAEKRAEEAAANIDKALGVEAAGEKSVPFGR